jgi:hypothetical protein
MDMLAGLQREQGVRGVIAHLGFHGHHLSALEEFVLGDEFRAELLAGGSSSGRFFAHAHEFPVRRGHGESDFVRPVRIGRAYS